jgi:hypothetical protein
MFNLNTFIMKTLKGMIGNYPDFQVMEYALNWYAKGKLTEENLAEVESLIDAKNTPVVIPEVSVEPEMEEVVEGEPTTEPETEVTEGETTEETPVEEPTETVPEEVTEE